MATGTAVAQSLDEGGAARKRVEDPRTLVPFVEGGSGEVDPADEIADRRSP